MLHVALEKLCCMLLLDRPWVSYAVLGVNLEERHPADGTNRNKLAKKVTLHQKSELRPYAEKKLGIAHPESGAF